MVSPAELAHRIASGDRQAIARAISAVENETAEAPAIRAALANADGHAHVVGITGPPGAGKSTLVNALIGALLARGKTVAVAAVDPSSTLSGGALLGDRIRMTEHQANERVYIRSLAARGHLGGLTRSIRGVLEVLDAACFDVVLVETVGTGQSEVEIAGIAHTRLVVCPPDLGDEVQAIKAGVFEIADIFVINKADTTPSARAQSLLLEMVALRRPTTWAVPVLGTVATTRQGVDAVLAAIERHQAWRQQRAASGAEWTRNGWA
jgi:LAO/AO transport system ATPase